MKIIAGNPDKKTIIHRIIDGRCSNCNSIVIISENEYEPTLKNATCEKCSISWTVGD